MIVFLDFFIMFNLLIIAEIITTIQSIPEDNYADMFLWLLIVDILALTYMIYFFN